MSQDRHLVAIWDSKSQNTRVAIDSSGLGMPTFLSRTSIDTILSNWETYSGSSFNYLVENPAQDWIKVWPVEEQSFIVSGSSPKPRKEWQPDEISPNVDVMDVTRGLIG